MRVMEFDKKVRITYYLFHAERKIEKELIYMQMDVRQTRFPEQYFDTIIDKGGC